MKAAREKGLLAYKVSSRKTMDGFLIKNHGGQKAALKATVNQKLYIQNYPSTKEEKRSHFQINESRGNKSPIG